MPNANKKVSIEEKKNTKDVKEISFETDIEVPDEFLVKFKTCVCGALLDALEVKCWACGHQFDQKEKPSEENNEGEIENILGTKISFAKFVSCPNCGANNELLEDETICWSCNFIISSGLNLKKNASSSKNTFISQDNGNKEKNQTRRKKKIIKYVLHCDKCNSWYVFNSYSKEMKCNSCKNTNTVFVSYTCPNCNKMFDINKANAKEKCPYCKSELVLTKETQLY